MTAFLRTIGFAQPSRWVDADTIEDWTGSKPKFISSKIGNDKRAFLAEGETGLDLAEKAYRDLTSRLNTVPAWDLVIFVTQNPDYKLPHMSALFQDRCGISQNAACFDMNLGCSGFVYAVKTAQGFLEATGGNHALIVTCDPYSRIMTPSDRNTVTVFGDAAAAAWVSTEEGGGKILDGQFGTDGSGGKNLIAEDLPVGHVPETSISGTQLASRLHMNGRAILEFMMTRIPVLVDECLEKNNLNRDDIDHYVFHQASGYMLKQLTRHMELSSEHVPVNLGTFANTVSSSIPIMLASLEHDNQLCLKRVLLCGFGVGLSWAALVLEYGD